MNDDFDKISESELTVDEEAPLHAYRTYRVCALLQSSENSIDGLRLYAPASWFDLYPDDKLTVAPLAIR